MLGTYVVGPWNSLRLNGFTLQLFYAYVTRTMITGTGFLDSVFSEPTPSTAAELGLFLEHSSQQRRMGLDQFKNNYSVAYLLTVPINCTSSEGRAHFAELPSSNCATFVQEQT